METHAPLAQCLRPSLLEGRFWVTGLPAFWIAVHLCSLDLLRELDLSSRGGGNLHSAWPSHQCRALWAFTMWSKVGVGQAGLDLTK